MSAGDARRRAPVGDARRRAPIVDARRRAPIVDARRRAPIVDVRRRAPIVDARRRALLIALSCAVADAAAIDNPEAPDHVGEFEARAKPLEDAVANASDAAATAVAQRAYGEFLERELNIAYRQLLPKLDAAAGAALVASQRQWLAFRRSENAFIAANWTPKHFGSSSAMSRADYAAAIVRQRVVVLYSYLRNYPPDKR